MNEILSSNPHNLYKAMRSKKQKADPPIHSLDVGEKSYSGENVADGFYDALSELKSMDHSSNPFFLKSSEMSSHIIQIAENGIPIPQIPLSE